MTAADELVERVRMRRNLPSPEDRKRIRMEAGVSQRELAQALGVSHGLIRHWENGGNPRDKRAAYAHLLQRLKELCEE